MVASRVVFAAGFPGRELEGTFMFIFALLVIVQLPLLKRMQRVLFPSLVVSWGVAAPEGVVVRSCLPGCLTPLPLPLEPLPPRGGRKGGARGMGLARSCSKELMSEPTQVISCRRRRASSRCYAAMQGGKLLPNYCGLPPEALGW